MSDIILSKEQEKEFQKDMVKKTYTIELTGLERTTIRKTLIDAAQRDNELVKRLDLSTPEGLREKAAIAVRVLGKYLLAPLA